MNKLGWIVLALILFVVAYFFHNVTKDIVVTAAIPTLPACDDSFFRDQAIKVFAEGPVGKTYNLKIIDMKAASEQSRTPSEVICKARVRLNSAAEVDATYRSFKDDGKTFIEIKLE